jgi:hypothetical protein
MVVSKVGVGNTIIASAVASRGKTTPLSTTDPALRWSRRCEAACGVSSQVDSINR